MKHIGVLILTVMLWACKTPFPTGKSSDFALGKTSQINVGCHSLVESISFFEKIGYTNFNAEGNWAQMSDDESYLFVQEDANSYMALVYFDTTILKKRAYFDSIKQPEFKHQMMDGHLLSITVESPEKFYLTMVQALPYALEKPPIGTNKKMGKLKYIRLYSTDLKTSLKFWKQVGFEIKKEDKNEIVISDNINTIQLIKNKTIQNPELVYDYKTATMKGFALDLTERMLNDKQEFVLQSPDGFNCVLEP